MTNREIMKKHLLSDVVSALIADGFTGAYPHYRKLGPDCIELVTFQTNKHGGSFTVEVSAVFPSRKNTNCVSEEIVPDTVNVWDTNLRYRLKGMYDGWFYFQDLYVKRIWGLGKVYFEASGEQKNFPSGYRLVQAFNETTAKKICAEVNAQLVKAYKWLKRFKEENIQRG